MISLASLAEILVSANLQIRTSPPALELCCGRPRFRQDCSVSALCLALLTLNIGGLCATTPYSQTHTPAHHARREHTPHSPAPMPSLTPHRRSVRHSRLASPSATSSGPTLSFRTPQTQMVRPASRLPPPRPSHVLAFTAGY